MTIHVINYYVLFIQSNSSLGSTYLTNSPKNKSSSSPSKYLTLYILFPNKSWSCEIGQIIQTGGLPDTWPFWHPEKAKQKMLINRKVATVRDTSKTEVFWPIYTYSQRKQSKLKTNKYLFCESRPSIAHSDRYESCGLKCSFLRCF